tara:strand:+ start:1377 stop:1928 length:552 start_codon:yes stop_codon:yes gene_type:complete
MSIKILASHIRDDVNHISQGCHLKNKRSKLGLSNLIILLLSPEAIIIYLFRISQLFYRLNLEIISVFFKYIIFYIFNCDLSYKAQIKGGIRFIHPFGIVIPDFCRIGEYTTIFKNVTIGSKYPFLNKNKLIIIERFCILSSGSVILTGSYIPERMLVGANLVLSKDLRTNKLKGCKRIDLSTD